MLRSAICVLRHERYQTHDEYPYGVVHIRETSPNGPLSLDIFISGISPGNHGFHLHNSGNELHAPDSLCSHFNPTKALHGGLNDPQGHYGDFGNITVDENGNCETTIVALYVRMKDVLGRSLIVHADEDDLGLGPYPDSRTTGHSGKRILWGIIGVDEPCS